jgi:ethanolamine ammonia-lyase large subunit
MTAAASLRSLFALANPFKEGDLSVGGTADDRLRDDARRELAATSVGAIRRGVLVDDGVSEALQQSRDSRFDGDLDELTIARLKTILLGPDGPVWVQRYRNGLASEVIAAVVKTMTNDELSSVARALFNPLGEGDAAIGGPHRFGSRIQPNSPGDDDGEILFSILEGLSYGCGDVIVGLNPAADELDAIVRLEQLLEQVVQRLELPTRYCVLSDIVKQHQARGRARVDVGFQSLAGTSRALAGMVGLDVDGVTELAKAFDGLYFETGQGSEVTNGAAESVDMVTLESRAYGVARYIRQRVAASTGGPAPWMIVNDVAGFIGPEVFKEKEQLERVCLEDMVMAKLHGLTMGLDVCATFHMGITPAELRELTTRIVSRAAPAYLMAVAGNADPMLGYLTTSFRQHPVLRRDVRRTVTPALEQRLTGLGMRVAAPESQPHGAAVARLYATYSKAGGDERSTAALEDEGRRRLGELRERGFDLGNDDASASDARLDALYLNARRALYASLDEAVLRNVMPLALRVNTQARDRDDYLAHPAAGEGLREDAVRAVRAIQSPSSLQALLIVSDGLNANAVNEQLGALLPPLRRLLAGAGVGLATTEVVVHNGRVRVGYEIGGLAGAEVVIHVVGERPGTGLNTLSAYLTYGRDAHGAPRWRRSLDHSATTAICSIHPKGKPPDSAAKEIARTVVRMLEQKRSGVALISAVS